MSATKTKKTTKTKTAKSTRKATKDALASIQKNVDAIDGGDGKKTRQTKREAKPKKLSAIDAAAQVLAETKTPMNTREMSTAMAEKKLWTSPGGKTPHATLYSAILQEINEKGKEARFTKTERGKFAASGV
jgi:HB1, ASXL, restriction endonuclease HTH domain